MMGGGENPHFKFYVLLLTKKKCELLLLGIFSYIPEKKLFFYCKSPI